jgi:hypothetical protein
MKTTFQLADISIEVEGDPEFQHCFSRYTNAAVHALPPTRQLVFRVEGSGGSYWLPSGQTEISPEVAAETLWLDIEAEVGRLLRDWLQLRGICIASRDGWVLVIGDDQRTLRLAAVEAMAAGIDVASTSGLCLKGELAIPYASPLHMAHKEFRQIDPAGLRFPGVRTFHDEMGFRCCNISPADFGLSWCIADLPLRQIASLDWNEGGQTCLGRLPEHWTLERILDAAYLPDSLAVNERLALVLRARQLAARTPILRLQVGSLKDVPSALSGLLAVSPEHA